MLCMEFEKKERAKVLVVGGGLAGLSAAVRLCREKEKFSVTLLEAEDEVGGRIKSGRFPDGSQVPLGAVYFHGTRGNSLFEYALGNGLARKGDVVKDSEREFLYLTTEGTRLPHDLMEKTWDRVQDLLDDEELLGAYNGSVKSYLEEHLTPFIKKHFASTTNCSPSLLLEGFLAFEGVSEGSKYARDISTSAYNEAPWLEGEREAFVSSDTMQRIVDSLFSALPGGVVHTGKEVVGINWNRGGMAKNGSNVLVTASDGSTYPVDHVILTVSLGILKDKVGGAAGAGTFFSPPLPAGHAQAIRCTGYGLVNKIILQFDDYLFDPKYTVLQLHWTESDAHSPLVLDQPWARGLHFIEHLPMVTSSNKFYVAWLNDEDALAVESVGHEVIKETIVSLFRGVFKGLLPSLVGLMTTSWSAKSTRGSYSFSPVGYDTSLRVVLGVPVDGGSGLEIMFAGEATHPYQFSCAHAAFDTGLREAERLIEYYSQN